MHVDDVVPVRPAHAMEDAVAQDAGIVNQDVDAAERIDRRLHSRLGVLRLGDREGRGDGLAAGLLDFAHDLLRRPLIAARAVERRADVDHDDACTFLRHQHRDGAPDAAARTSDDRDLARNETSHCLPHTSFASSTIMRSLAHCSSSLNTLPSSVEAKPHWGETQSWSRAMYFVASSIRRLMSSLFSSAPILDETSPSTICLFPFGTKRRGSKPPARSVSYSR